MRLALLSLVLALGSAAASDVNNPDQCSSVDAALFAVRNDPALSHRTAELEARELEKRACCGRCSGKCTTGQKKAAVTKGNGCGPAGWWNKVVPELIFNGCCNTHDMCYTKCGTTKASCDQAFAGCMRGRCYAQYGKLNPVRYVCTDLADKYASAVVVGGCPAFKSASKRHCKC